MGWSQEVSESEAVQKVLNVPLGAASPLWVAYGVAASAGLAYWWMTRWAQFTNLEGLASLFPAGAEPAKAEPATPPVEAAPSMAPEAPSAHAATPAVEGVDDLTRLVGIGPKLAQALVERGVTTFAQIAAWTEEDVDEIDHALDLKGRVGRDAWVAQARRIAETPVTH